MDPKLEKDLEDPKFAAALEDMDEYYQEASDYYTYEPPDGEYICMLTEVMWDYTESKKLEKEVLRIRVKCQIMHGDEKDTVFDLSGAFGWTSPFLTSLKTLASTLAEDSITHVGPALSVLRTMIGQWMKVKVERVEGKEGRVYTNFRVVEKLEADAPEETQ